MTFNQLLFPKTAIVLFAKTPILGQVKTRLAKSIGQELALKLHTAFIYDFLDQVSKLLNLADIYLCLTEVWNPSTITLPKNIENHQVKISYQSNGDLGGRLYNTFLECFSLGYQNVIITGTDSPNLPILYLEEAILALDSLNIVLGEALDGGYYLIGIQHTVECLDEIFNNISWSTEKVFSQTINKIQKNQLSLHCLPKWYDIDELADLQRLKKDLEISITSEQYCINTRILLHNINL
jgi:rSAM/selenodomain-associated transferase 1